MFQSALHPKVKGIRGFPCSRISSQVSIRPSPKGEGNQAGAKTHTETTGFQSALHPKVKGISAPRAVMNRAMMFQSALHPKVKGITSMSNCKFVTLDQVSIRPSPKGEGNQHFIFRRNFIGQFQFALLPKVKGIHVKLQVCDTRSGFNPPFSRR